MNRLNFCDSVAKIQKSFRFKNKSKAYFYGNFLSTLEKYKSYTKNNLK